MTIPPTPASAPPTARAAQTARLFFALALAGAAGGCAPVAEVEPQESEILTITRKPADDPEYHDYAEVVADLDAVVAAHGSIVSKIVIGKSVQGRDLVGVSISDSPTADENEPEILLVGGHHARERLSVEQALYVVHLLAEGYATDPRIAALVNGRRFFVVPNVNPDGSEFDVSDNQYHAWRKNRSPNPDGTFGIDLNRNYGYEWGCCFNGSPNPPSVNYKGELPYSSPEVAALRDFVRSRVLLGRQRIRTAVSFHSYGEKIVYPFSYTAEATPAGRMAADDHATFAALAGAMASRNGYKPTQAGKDMYIHEGTFEDWAWGEQRIFAFNYELYPTDAPTLEEDRFYPPGSVVAAQTARNKEALLYLFERADCPYAAIDKAGLCTPAALAGKGLQAVYYTGTNFGKAVLARLDAQVSFNWSGGSPGAVVPNDGFSVRWTGKVQPQFTETYTFHTTSDDGVRLWVNGVKLVDNWTPHGPTPDAGTIALVAGPSYDIKLEYFEQTGGAQIFLDWQSPSRPRQRIPQSRLVAF